MLNSAIHTFSKEVENFAYNLTLLCGEKVGKEITERLSNFIATQATKWTINTSLNEISNQVLSSCFTPVIAAAVNPRIQQLSRPLVTDLAGRVGQVASAIASPFGAFTGSLRAKPLPINSLMEKFNSPLLIV